ncbi:MAG: hypothetical protein KDA57_08160 [Planctomycetales bacterium]|nr:hypothetical protein [Planctomycetales bacterium]
MTDNIFHRIIEMPPPFNMIVIIMMIIFGTGLVTSVVKQIRKYACYRQEVEFKRDLLDRGMTVEEVERVVSAQPKDSSRA